MKKLLIALLLLLVICRTVAACGNSDDTTAESTAQTTVPSTTNGDVTEGKNNTSGTTGIWSDPTQMTSAAPSDTEEYPNTDTTVADTTVADTDAGEETKPADTTAEPVEDTGENWGPLIPMTPKG